MPTANSKKGRLLMLGLLVIAGISLWRTVSVEHEKRELASGYEKAKQSLAELESERAELSNELVSARDTLNDKEENLQGLQQQLSEVQTRLDATVVDLASLQQDHERLREANASLTTQLSSVVTEKQQLEAKLSDIKQLRLAIRDVRQKINERRWAAWRERVDAQRQADAQALASGNRGYLVQGGQPTFAAGRKLQVQVLDPELR